jgi:alkanesulfonate monooxygenase SsuD/methylene tetrahydromethanopterin reductase-like flavin-dependent oxidoreductase (luciferase family)
VWVGAHHVTQHLYYQSVPTIARLSAHAGRTQTGPFLLLPLYHPVLLAEQMATLDVITDGRLTLMVALGWQPEAYAAFGLPWKERVPRFGEAVEILQRLFAKDPADHRGRSYPLEGVSFQPKPVHGRIPLWIGAGAEPAIRRAARLGNARIIGPLSALEVVKAQMRIYDAVLQEYGGLCITISQKLLKLLQEILEVKPLSYLSWPDSMMVRQNEHYIPEHANRCT